MDDEELVGELRKQILETPTLREPHDAGYYSNMVKYKINNIEEMLVGADSENMEVYAIVPPKQPRVVPRVWWAWAYRLYWWAKEYPEELSLVIIGMGIMALIDLIVILILLV